MHLDGFFFMNWIGYLEKGNLSMFQPRSKFGRTEQPVHLHADNTHYVDKERDTIHKHTADMVRSDPTSFDSWSHYPTKMTYTRTTSVTSRILNFTRYSTKGKWELTHIETICVLLIAEECRWVHRGIHPVAQRSDSITTGPTSAVCYAQPMTSRIRPPCHPSSLRPTVLYTPSRPSTRLPHCKEDKKWLEFEMVSFMFPYIC